MIFILLFLLSVCRINEALAHCLTSFHELMDHGEVSWDILTHGFIKNVIITNKINYFLIITYFFFMQQKDEGKRKKNDMSSHFFGI